MQEILASIVEDRRKVIIEQMEKGGPEGDFTDAEGRLRLGHLHVLKQYASLPISIPFSMSSRQYLLSWVGSLRSRSTLSVLRES